MDRARWVGFDFSPQAGHEDAQMLRILCLLLTPNLFQQELMREYLTGVLHQRDEDFVFHPRQMHFSPSGLNPSRSEIDF
jgi:hypothetical protein